MSAHNTRESKIVQIYKIILIYAKKVVILQRNRIIYSKRWKIGSLKREENRRLYTVVR
jgi:hypothetical protein